ncbi:MAG: LPS export ABC transporter periplasmic protein LptC [Candidatus Cloacimonetes bacterium]|nr:LPS export ABC transporter periplasmic protein LptC [Candidatus Cloacimonadota bacterium]
MVKKTGFLLLLLLSFVSLLSVEGELRPYRLIHADSLEAVKENGAYVSELRGNVHFFYGDTEFYTDTAHIYEEQKIVMMVGNVKIYDDTLSLQAKEVEYFRRQEKLKLNGSVFLEESHRDSTWRTFNAEKVEYLRDQRNFQAWDNVKMFDSREQINGSCGYLTYNGEKGFGFLRDKPELSLAQQDTITIKAQKIEYYDEYKKIVAIFEVETIFSEYLITSDFLIYFSEQEKAIYRGEPRLYSSLFDAEASEVTIFFVENALERAELQDSCLVTYKVTEEGSKENSVSSDDMEFIFTNKVISECRAHNNIISNYIQQEDPSKRQDYLENLSRGNELIMYMDEKGYIDHLNMQGNISGTYKFSE